ncbi:bifunctional riboflavin kinase/FAD synthetase [Marinicella rhabdoformis]|uniref:bifunctional riboflavin kinase/FAD synthetase n=1 Tax=Marinicella rhabdoformis TaxID=2580566 RepID=UPI0015D04685|nr:bifunctional riboflavin kinase/FAD synthetase [Marinicella rhabdoformis]
MEIIRYPHHTSLNSLNNSVTIGNFDGVHLGHQKLIEKVVNQAKITDGLAVVVTMQPLPVQYFQGKHAVPLVTSFKQKVKLMVEQGVDVLCVLNFNKQLSTMTALDFFNEILVEGLKARYLLVGDDFQFGANRAGDAAFLALQCHQAQIKFEQQNSVLLNGRRVSSSLIRSALAVGDFKQVKCYLGRDYVVAGRVAHGKKLGRTLGFPTLNIHFKNGETALHGIFVVKVKIKSQWHEAVASVGYNPTVKDSTKRLEVHVLDWSGEIYGQWIEVLFYKKLRNEVEFDGLSALKAGILSDVKAARKYFEENTGDLV